MNFFSKISEFYLEVVRGEEIFERRRRLDTVDTSSPSVTIDADTDDEPLGLRPSSSSFDDLDEARGNLCLWARGVRGECEWCERGEPERAERGDDDLIERGESELGDGELDFLSCVY